MLVAAGGEALIGTGYRLRLGAVTLPPQTVYAQALAARRPFSIDRYYTLGMKLARIHGIAGYSPQLVEPMRWRDLGSGISFSAPLLGEAYGNGNVHNSPASSEFASLATPGGSRLSLASLRGPQVYITSSVAQPHGVHVRDLLFARVRSQVGIFRVAGIVRDGQLLASMPGVVMSLTQVQQLFGQTGTATSLIQAYVASSPSQAQRRARALQRAVAASIPIAGARDLRWHKRLGRRRRRSSDQTDWLVLGLLAFLGLGGLGLFLMGGRTTRARMS